MTPQQISQVQSYLRKRFGTEGIDISILQQDLDEA